MEEKSTHVTLEEVPLPDADLWTITSFAQRITGMILRGPLQRRLRLLKTQIQTISLSCRLHCSSVPGLDATVKPKGTRPQCENW